MEVVVVDPSAYTPPYDAVLCGALARRGLDVELLTSRFLHGPVPESVGFKREEFFYRRTSKWFFGKSDSRLRLPVKLLEHPADMRRLLRRLRTGSDIVHFQWLTVQPLDVGFIRRIGQPVVLTAHDVLPREPRPGQLGASRRLYDAADAVIVHTDHGRRRLVGELGIDGEKVHVIPHGAFDFMRALDPAMPAELESTGGRPFTLFFGLLRPYKGVDTLLDAWARLGDPDRLLVVAGKPRMPLEPLRAQARRLGIEDRVLFIPRFLDDSEAAYLFGRAELTVLPYREIDQSGVLYTALAFGKPIVLTRVGGFSEIADRDGAAVAVMPGDADALAGAIDDLLADTNKRDAVAARAVAVAAGRYNWDRIAEQTEALYLRLSG